MTANPTGRFACDDCGKQYAWNPDLAGRRVKCACGCIMTAPMAATLDGEGLYDLADDPPPRPQSAVPVKTAPFMVGEGAVVPVAVERSRVLDYKKPQTLGTSAEDRNPIDREREVIAPLFLLGGGILVELGRAVILSPRTPGAIIARMEALGLRMGIGLAVMLVSILIVGKLRKINFGPWPLAMLKLCAVMVGPEVVMIFVRPVLGLIPIVGGLGNAIVGFCLSFALLGTFFDLDQSDTWHLICVTIIVYLIGLFSMMWLAPGLI